MYCLVHACHLSWWAGGLGYHAIAGVGLGLYGSRPLRCAATCNRYHHHHHRSHVFSAWLFAAPQPFPRRLAGVTGAFAAHGAVAPPTHGSGPSTLTAGGQVATGSGSGGPVGFPTFGGFFWAGHWQPRVACVGPIHLCGVALHALHCCRCGCGGTCAP